MSDTTPALEDWIDLCATCVHRDENGKPRCILSATRCVNYKKETKENLQ